jgi:hypothetical protein
MESAEYQNHKSKITSLGGLEGVFTLENFDTYVNSYKNSNFLAPEANKGFLVLLNALNDFCDTIEELTENDVKSSIIEWYSNATISNTDIIRAKSQYYNSPAFSDVSISMDAEEAQDYNTAEGICFGKVKLT